MIFSCPVAVLILQLATAKPAAGDPPITDFDRFRVPGQNGVTRYSQPILSPAGDEDQACNPTVIAVGDRLAMIYRTNFKRSRLRLAFSDDGRTFARDPSETVMMPDEPFDKDGCEDPRVVRFGDLYYLTYVGIRHGQCLATSTDLIHWDKKGICLTPAGWNRGQVKAAVIVPERVGGRHIMYFLGETQPWHTKLGMAVSDDLLHWTQPLDRAVMDPRADHFDSEGVEPGATPIMLPEGILLIYNGWNPGRTHQTGWALFSRDDPSKLLQRCEDPFIRPTFDYEKSRRPSSFNVTFTEGCVLYRGLWRFYYGAEDHDIGLAEMADIRTLLMPKHPQR
jgi:predicted GH43/DUF377 family glycosyl hydrolase